MRVEVFKIEHLSRMKSRRAVGFSKDFAAHAPFSFSIFREDGELLFCGGVAEYWPGRGETWGVFNDDCRREFPSLHRIVKGLLRSCPTRRLELSVEQEFANGHRWARALGFSLVAVNQEAYFPDGKAASIYAKVRPCRS